MPIERSKCDLLDVCSNAIDAVKAAHPEQVVESKFLGDLKAFCDVTRMEQALGNLLNNAVQHGDSSQPITVLARKDADAIVLTVANRGQPIPREALTQIFEPMFRLPPERNESFEQRSRVGLGLFIVKQIVEGHGGTVSVESSVAETVFTVRLPDACLSLRTEDLTRPG